MICKELVIRVQYENDTSKEAVYYIKYMFIILYFFLNSNCDGF